MPQGLKDTDSVTTLECFRSPEPSICCSPHPTPPNFGLSQVLVLGSPKRIWSGSIWFLGGSRWFLGRSSVGLGQSCPSWVTSNYIFISHLVGHQTIGCSYGSSSTSKNPLWPHQSKCWPISLSSCSLLFLVLVPVRRAGSAEHCGVTLPPGGQQLFLLLTATHRVLLVVISSPQKKFPSVKEIKIKYKKRGDVVHVSIQ